MSDETGPQLENGYTRIANELLDALLCAGLTSRQWAVMMAIIRKTYGFNKKSDEIGLSQLHSMTGIDRANLSRTVRELESMRLIIRGSGTFGHTLGVNKNFRQWGLPKQQQGLSFQQLPKQQQGVCQNGNEGVVVLANLVLSKRQPQKTYQKTNQKTVAPSEKISLDAGGVWVGIPPVLLAKWNEAYPALSLDAELAKASAWIIANPKNKKSNYARFLTNWLARAQDSAPRQIGATNNRPKLVL